MPLEIPRPADGHCFSIQFDGTSGLEADTGHGRTRAERFYEIRRRYLLKVENSCVHQLRNCRLLLMSAVDANGKEHVRSPIQTCEPFALSPGEPKTVPVIAVIFDNLETPIRIDPISEAQPGKMLLPPNCYTLSLRMLSDDSAPFSFRLSVESAGSSWSVREIKDDPFKQFKPVPTPQSGEILTLKPSLWGVSIDLKQLCRWIVTWRKAKQ